MVTMESVLSNLARMLSAYIAVLAHARVVGNLIRAMASIRSWLKQMTGARDPGPATHVTVRPAKTKRVILRIGGDIGNAAKRVEKLCIGSAARRVRCAYILLALDDAGRRIGVKTYVPGRRVRSRKPLRMPIPPVVVESMFSAAEVARSYESLGIESLIQVQKNQERVMKALEEENRRLREENAALGDRIHIRDERHARDRRSPD
jgi:hypothetical protein